MHPEFDPRTGDRDMSREIQHRADVLLREREPMMSRSTGPPPAHQDPRFQPTPQDIAYGGQQRSHTPLSRSDHGPPPLQHPPRSSLGDSHPLFSGPPRPEERFRDPFARENNRLREEQTQREELFAGHRDRERREREFHELRERDTQMQRERMMGRGPPQGPPAPDQRGTPGPPQGPGGMDWANAVPRQHGEWRR
jgi:serine/arginine repetitive matrix protein 2